MQWWIAKLLEYAVPNKDKLLWVSQFLFTNYFYSLKPLIILLAQLLAQISLRCDPKDYLLTGWDETSVWKDIAVETVRLRQCVLTGGTYLILPRVGKAHGLVRETHERGRKRCSSAASHLPHRGRDCPNL
jgi:hypothetical protein